MSCKICNTRRPRRFCAGVRGDICPQCCGEQREVTVDCPLDCEFLEESRRHEKKPQLTPDQIPNRDIRVTERFIQEHESLSLYLALRLLETTLGTPGAVDSDVAESLEALIRTYRTLGSGLIYETKPQNPVAAAIYEGLQAAVEEFRKLQAERTGMASVRDSDILGVLVFLQQMELQESNGRPRGRAYVDFLRAMFPKVVPPAEGRQSSLIV